MFYLSYYNKFKVLWCYLVDYVLLIRFMFNIIIKSDRIKT